MLQLHRFPLLALSILPIGAAPAAAQTLPPVTSGTLVAQWSASSADLTVDAAGRVQEWRAVNDPTLALIRTSVGQTTNPDVVEYAPDGMRCAGTVRFRDASATSSVWLEDDLPAAWTFEDVTIFWLGYYENDPSTLMRVAYSLGTQAGSGARKMSHGIGQSGLRPVRLWNGSWAASGDSIAAEQNEFQVWRTEYYGSSTAPTHRAFVGGTDLNVPDGGQGYAVLENRLTVGRSDNGGTSLSGAISELIVYQGTLSAADSAAVEGYLAARVADTLGTAFCDPSVPNSGGQSGRIEACGSLEVAANDLHLRAFDLTVNQFGYFLASRTEGAGFTPPGSAGVLCLTGNIGRFNATPSVITGPVGTLQVDLSALPVNPTAPALPGETWRFQCWYRDQGQASNFTDGVAVLLQ